MKKVIEICPLCGCKLDWIHAYRENGVYVCRGEKCDGEFNEDNLKKVEA